MAMKPMIALAQWHELCRVPKMCPGAQPPLESGNVVDRL